MIKTRIAVAVLALSLLGGCVATPYYADHPYHRGAVYYDRDYDGDRGHWRHRHHGWHRYHRYVYPRR